MTFRQSSTNSFTFMSDFASFVRHAQILNPFPASIGST